MVRIYTFKANVWIYPEMVGWHFVTLSKKDTEDINFYFSEKKRGFGSLPVIVTIGKSTWKTSIFPDKESGLYIPPLKKEVRKKESINEGDKITLSLEINI